MNSIEHKICSDCRQLTLERLSHTASCQIKGNYGYPEKEDDLLALKLGVRLPIVFQLENIYNFHSQCAVCRLLFQQLDSGSFKDHQFLEGYICKGLNGQLQSIWFYFLGSQKKAARIDLYGIEGSVSAERLFHRPITTPGSDESIDRIRQWIGECIASHSSCQLDLSGSYVLRFPKLPTRVIDLGYIGCCDVNLIPGHGIQANYVALSHCWGGASLMQTTMAKLNQFQKIIKYESLPKTIRDTVYLTRALGIRYLWVDSLCIIQDDDEDWSREAKTMASVYEGAYFTIAATAAKDGTEGLFPPRPPQKLLEVPCDSKNLSAGYMLFGLKKNRGEYSVFEEPLNTRAWVYQERMFSRRTVHFASEQTYWGCDTCFIAEDNHLENDPMTKDLRMIPMRSMLRYNLTCYFGKNSFPVPKEVAEGGEKPFGTNADFHTIWAQGIVFFTRCGLTKKSDRLPALYSLAKTLENLTHHKYHEGHWFDDSNFSLTGLLWHSAPETKLERFIPPRAPSWSWASLEGPIRYLDFGEYWTDIFHPSKWEMKILRVELFRPLLMEPIKSLLLNAAKIPCTKCICTSDFVANSASKFTDVVSERGELIQGNFEFDVEDDQPFSFWLVPVYYRWLEPEPTKFVWFVLIVSEILGQKKKEVVFRRVGCGSTGDPSWLCERKRGFMVIT